MTFKSPNSSRPALDFTAVFRGTAVSVAFTLLATLIMGSIYYISGLSESTLPVVSSSLLFLSVFAGGFASSRRSGSMGLFHGLGVGFLIFLLIWLLMGLFLSTGVAFIPLAQKFFVCLAGGALGGILGVSF